MITARPSPTPRRVLVLTALFAAVALALLGPGRAGHRVVRHRLGDHRPGPARSGRRRARRRRCSSSTSRCCPRCPRRPRSPRSPPPRSPAAGWCPPCGRPAYALPAYLTPIAFVVTDHGQGLLGLRSFPDMAWTTAVAALAVAALAVVTGGGRPRATWPERFAHRRLRSAVSQPGDDRCRIRTADGGGGRAPCHRSQTTNGITRSAASR